MRINAQPRLRRLFRLRTILMAFMLSVLLLPLISLFFFRVYENELVQKTELELIAQSAVLASTYRYLVDQQTSPPYPQDLQTQETRTQPSVPYYHPISPTLDLSVEDTLPRREPAQPADRGTSLEAINAGRKMQPIIKNTQRVTLAGIRILDENGIVITGRNELGLSLAHIPEVQQALKGEYKAVIRQRISDEPPPPIASLSRGTGIRVFTAFPIINEKQVLGVVYLSRTPQNILKHLYQIKEKVTLLIFLMLATTMIMVLFISSRLSRPIRELTQQSQQLAKGKIDTIEVLHQPGTYELAELSSSFSRMSKALHKRNTYIRQFASHVSHEFKTPLTGIQGALELLSDHDESMSQEQRQKFLHNLREDTEHLKKLVNRLLEFAHADALHPSNETANLIRHLDPLKREYSQKGLDIVYESQNDLSVNIAEEALKSILSNLFQNSLQHEADKITLTIENQPNHIILKTLDNGSGISPANGKKIFTPFFTTRRETGGTGLGLGIIESLLSNWGGSIKWLASEHGASFELLFRKAHPEK